MGLAGGWILPHAAANAPASAPLSRLLSPLPHPTPSRAATDALQSGANTTPGFVIALLRIVDSGANDLAIRQAAATFFKNVIRRHWVRGRRCAPGWRPRSPAARL